jgi:uroporphyrin-III C-methyltransferase/precorrin-2 dehydrogenase/sirohydrochlorin ferrochelatase
MSAPTLLGLRLTGRLVVAVGGGVVTARRVTDLVAEGAVVHVVSPHLCEDLVDLVAAGSITWVDRDYLGPEDLEGAWLVHTATGDGLVDARVGRDAEVLRVWCVDAADAGRASAEVPARARVATPDGPVSLAVHAGGDPRRAVAIRSELVSRVESGAIDLRARRPRGGAGWVALVGGGPGAVDLVTARGRTLLAAADVVVADRLGPTALLGDLHPGVRVVHVGKAPGHHLATQDEINAILVEEAQRGHGVVRLKGGDPYVLGRGGEERLACEAAGVPVEVVPGVSSATSVPAAAGIPLTHRGLARGFTVVTGHDEITALPTGNDHTVVVLMGVASLRRTAALLVGHGRDPRCPAAVVERGYAADQRVTTAALEDLAEAAEAVGAGSPAVVVIGDVVTLSPRWRP